MARKANAGARGIHVLRIQHRYVGGEAACIPLTLSNEDAPQELPCHVFTVRGVEKSASTGDLCIARPVLVLLCE